jgi:hypothetical protein
VPGAAITLAAFLARIIRGGVPPAIRAFAAILRLFFGATVHQASPCTADYRAIIFKSCEKTGFARR